jgi:hypothetical protein
VLLLRLPSIPVNDPPIRVVMCAAVAQGVPQGDEFNQASEYFYLLEIHIEMLRIASAVLVSSPQCNLSYKSVLQKKTDGPLSIACKHLENQKKVVEVETNESARGENNFNRRQPLL